jgi:MFS family permease
MQATETSQEQHLMRRLMWRLMPLVVLMYLVAIIDRANVGFAKLQMVGALGMSEVVYGLGASLFFIGYLVFEIPSALAVHRYGARRWFARIMLTWGIVTVLLGFTSSGPMFYTLRFLLGVAEAGLYPGLIYYLTLWFPQRYQVRVVGLLTLGSAFGNMSGSLLGGALLDLNGVLGLAGWQWVFVATGLPPILLTAAVLRWLPDTPAQAGFLEPGEKALLDGAIRRDKPKPIAHGNPLKVLLDGKVLFFSLLYILILTSLYGVIYWLPTVVKAFGVSGTVNGLLNMVPWALAAVMLVWLPRRLKQENVVLSALAVIALLGLLCFFSSTMLGDNRLRFIALAVGTPCISLLLPCFWSLPSRHFTGATAATSIAAISTVGNLGGFAAQNLMPWVGAVSGSAVGAMLVPALCLTALAAIAFALRHATTRRAAAVPSLVA